ncbi:MAG TPA: response regulator [Thermoanaerobaculia bacterium]|nr:response regulator [Thermoanaerobaculia bacterium]
MGREDKILVVEDNPVICREIEAKFNCDCATDGWDAIEKLEASDYAAIVIDADVPRHSGYGVLTYLREENGEELANVIFMTSNDRDGVQRRIGAGLHVIDKADAVDEIQRLIGS